MDSNCTQISFLREFHIQILSQSRKLWTCHLFKVEQELPGMISLRNCTGAKKKQLIPIFLRERECFK